MKGRFLWLRCGLWLFATMMLQLLLAQMTGVSPLLPLLLVCALGTGREWGLWVGLISGLLWDGLFYASGCSMTLTLTGVGALASQLPRLGLRSQYLEYLVAVVLGILFCETVRIVQGAGGILPVLWEGTVTFLLALPGYWLCPK